MFYRRTDGGAGFHVQQPPVLIAVLDGLRQGEPFGYTQRWPSGPSRPHRLAVGASDRLRVGPPAVGAPAHRLSPRAGMDLRDSLTRQGLLTSAAGVSDDEKRLWRSTIMQPHLSPRPGGSSAV